jgi:hypothetical protein
VLINWLLRLRSNRSWYMLIRVQHFSKITIQVSWILLLVVLIQAVQEVKCLLLATELIQ